MLPLQKNYKNCKKNDKTSKQASSCKFLTDRGDIAGWVTSGSAALKRSSSSSFSALSSSPSSTSGSVVDESIKERKKQKKIEN